MTIEWQTEGLEDLQKTSHYEGDPIRFSPSTGTYGFWDEVWANYAGGYETELAAKEALNEYCRTL